MRLRDADITVGERERGGQAQPALVGRKVVVETAPERLGHAELGPQSSKVLVGEAEDGAEPWVVGIGRQAGVGAHLLGGQDKCRQKSNDWGRRQVDDGALATAGAGEVEPPLPLLEASDVLSQDAFTVQAESAANRVGQVAHSGVRTSQAPGNAIEDVVVYVDVRGNVGDLYAEEPVSQGRVPAVVIVPAHLVPPGSDGEGATVVTSPDTRPPPGQMWRVAAEHVARWPDAFVGSPGPDSRLVGTRDGSPR